MIREQAAEYAVPADSTRLEALATRLRERNFEVLVVTDAANAPDPRDRQPEGRP